MKVSAVLICDYSVGIMFDFVRIFIFVEEENENWNCGQGT